MSAESGLRSLDEVGSRLDQAGVPGLSLAFQSGDGELVSRTWGVTAVEDGSAVTEQTIFQAGSVTKVVTAYAALRLAADGRLDLDADVNSVLTSWQLPRVWAWQPAVTTRMLLAHVGGVSSSWGDGYSRTDRLPSLVEELAGRAGGVPVQVEALPGLVWFYCGGGYQVVAQVICDVTGQTFPEAVADLVFAPLGMSSSTVEQPLPEVWHGVAARGHLEGRQVGGGWRYPGGAGAVGLWTTPRDLIVLARAVNAGAAPQMLDGHPVEPRMGLGPMLARAGGVGWWFHDGSVTGYECRLVGVRGADGGFAVAAMTNAGGWHGVHEQVCQLVCTQHGPGPVELTNLFGEVVDATIKLVAKQDQLVGEYRVPSGDTIQVIAPPGQFGPELHLVLPGQPPARLWPATERRWWIAGLAGTQITFDPPDRICITQYGREVRGTRQASS